MVPFFAPSEHETMQGCPSVSFDGSEESDLRARIWYEKSARERQYRRLRIANTLLTGALMLVACYATFLYVHLHREQFPLGTDPFGYIPADIGEPPIWTMFDKHDPYYIEYDVFENIENIEKTVQKLRSLEYSNGILTNGKNTSYLGSDGVVHELLPGDYFGSPGYLVRGIHQMHCIMVVTDEYGHRVHGQKTKWDPEHMAHCINVLREAVSCLADASVVSFTYPEDLHLGRDQQSRCRNYTALRNWVHDPVRTAKELQKNTG